MSGATRKCGRDRPPSPSPPDPTICIFGFSLVNKSPAKRTCLIGKGINYEQKNSG